MPVSTLRIPTGLTCKFLRRDYDVSLRKCVVRVGAETRWQPSTRKYRR